MPGINLNFDVSALIVLLLTSAGIAAAIWYYRATLPQVSARFRLLLIVLRGLAVSLILILLAGPLLRLSFTSVEPPVLALLIDNSTSMRVTDQHGNRADALRTLLRSDTFARIGKHAVLRPFTFGVHLTESADALRDTLPQRRSDQLLGRPRGSGPRA